LFTTWFARITIGSRAGLPRPTISRARAKAHCPICDDAVIERRPSVNVQVGRATAPAAEREEAPVVQIQAEAETLKALRQLIAHSDNVGAGFAEEARKIHYEEVPKRSIRGQATREEAAELRDEGIDFMSLPSALTRDLN
jgi:hypothetical protein